MSRNSAFLEATQRRFMSSVPLRHRKPLGKGSVWFKLVSSAGCCKSGKSLESLCQRTKTWSVRCMTTVVIREQRVMHEHKMYRGVSEIHLHHLKGINSVHLSAIYKLQKLAIQISNPVCFGCGLVCHPWAFVRVKTELAAVCADLKLTNMCVHAGTTWTLGSSGTSATQRDGPTWSMSWQVVFLSPSSWVILVLIKNRVF